MREKIRNIRLKSNISVGELASNLNISESMIRKVEAGLRTPSPYLAKKWADYLDIPEEDIFRYFFISKPDNMCKKSA
ncbi:helix-turn-helix transcriptional regulator [Pectinatus frisingensis]|uniref:helix-turn-helix transcriptional regulator n=1 Tax=Pectinatus frisingensis TaxID=865 RepID=UPI0018C69314|nr:helix-turn-helix transcriptional regulator [Pectinatus frisingensis]